MLFKNAPLFYEELHKLLSDACKNVHNINGFGFSFKLVETGHCIDTRNLSQAAAKYRLAKNVTGLSTEGYPASSETPQHYSAQVIISLSVVAFEAYCRLFDKNWHKVYFDIISQDIADQYSKAFSDIPLADDFFGRLKRAQDQKNGANLIRKIEAFESGETQNLYAVAVGFRNAFAHGRLGTLGGTTEVGQCLREFILDAVKLDCENRVHCINTF